MGLGYLFAAYLLIWIIFFAYLIRLTIGVNRVQRELEDLKTKLKKSEPRDSL